MSTEAETGLQPVNHQKVKRPFLVTLLCLFSFVFFGMIALLFLVSAFWSGRITEVMNYYLTGTTRSMAGVLGIAAGGFILHAACIAGCIMMWKMRRIGYYLFGIASLVITLLQLFNKNAATATIAVYILLIILFGIFYRKMESSGKK